MANIKRAAAITLILVLIISITGCGDSAERTEQTQTKVIDALGREIEKPDNIDNVAVTCYGGATHEISVLGASDKIVAQPSMERFPHLLKMFPAFKDVVDPGSFDDVNVEEIIKADPDMVFVGITAKKGNKLIEDAGFPTFTMLIGSANMDNIREEFEMAGILLDNEIKANELVEYWNTKLAIVEDMVSKVPEKDRKKVYYAGETITNASSGIWGDSLITGAGGINVTSSLAKGAKGAEVSVEQVIGWNPDVIIKQKTKNGFIDFENDDRIQDLAAMKNKELYQCPIGAFWWDRPSPEAPLGFMWLATVLYPEHTKDIDLKKETMEFYKKFYNYELTEDEYASFF